MVFEQSMLRYGPDMHRRERAIKVFLEGRRRLQSRSMVAVILMEPAHWQVTQGGSINRRGCGGAT